MPPLNTFQRACITAAVTQAIALPLHAATIIVDSNEDTSGSSSICTLRDAITIARDPRNEEIGGCSVVGDFRVDTINISSALGGQTITLSNPLPSVFASRVTINGNGVTIDGNSEIRHFTVQSGDLTLNSLTLTNGSLLRTGSRFNRSGGAIYVATGSLSLKCSYNR